MKGKCNGIAEDEAYMVDEASMNLRDKHQKWLVLKNKAKF